MTSTSTSGRYRSPSAELRELNANLQSIDRNEREVRNRENEYRQRNQQYTSSSSGSSGSDSNTSEASARPRSSGSESYPISSATVSAQIQQQQQQQQQTVHSVHNGGAHEEDHISNFENEAANGPRYRAPARTGSIGGGLATSSVNANNFSTNPNIPVAVAEGRPRTGRDENETTLGDSFLLAGASEFGNVGADGRGGEQSANQNAAGGKFSLTALSANNSRAVLNALRALQEKIRKLESERSFYGEKCEELKRENHTIQDSWERQRQQERQTSLEREQAWNTERDALHADKRKMMGELDDRHRRITDLEIQVQRLSSDLESTTIQKQNFQSQTSDLEAQLSSTRQDCQERVRQLQQSIEERDAKIRHLSLDVREYEEEISSLKHERERRAILEDEKTKLERALEEIIQINQSLVERLQTDLRSKKRLKKKSSKSGILAAGGGGGGGSAALGGKSSANSNPALISQISSKTQSLDAMRKRFRHVRSSGYGSSAPSATTSAGRTRSQSAGANRFEGELNGDGSGRDRIVSSNKNKEMPFLLGTTQNSQHVAAAFQKNFTYQETELDERRRLAQLQQQLTQSRESSRQREDELRTFQQLQQQQQQQQQNAVNTSGMVRRSRSASREGRTTDSSSLQYAEQVLETTDVDGRRSIQEFEDGSNENQSQSIGGRRLSGNPNISGGNVSNVGASNSAGAGGGGNCSPTRPIRSQGSTTPRSPSRPSSSALREREQEIQDLLASMENEYRALNHRYLDLMNQAKDVSLLTEDEATVTSELKTIIDQLESKRRQISTLKRYKTSVTSKIRELSSPTVPGAEKRARALQLLHEIRNLDEKY